MEAREGGGGGEEGEASSKSEGYAGEGEKQSARPPAGLTPEEYEELHGAIEEHHKYDMAAGRRCSSLLSQRVRAPADDVWSVVRRFDRPQAHKHFIRGCALKDPAGAIRVGCLREVSVVSGLPASTSTERLDVLDEGRRVVGFSIVGGEHRLRNYRSVTTVHELGRGGEGEAWSVVLESYAVDVPEGNTEEDTRLFADTVVRINLQKLSSVAEANAAGRGSGGQKEEEEEEERRQKAKKRRPGD